MIGAFISEMGFLLSFLFMTGWVAQYTTAQTAKEFSQEIGITALLVGNTLGLCLAIVADRTNKVIPMLALSFLIKGVPLFILGILRNHLA